MQTCKTNANSWVYIRLLWQKFALFARTLGGNMHSGTQLFNVLNWYSVQIEFGTCEQKLTKYHRTRGNLLMLMLASDF